VSNCPYQVQASFRELKHGTANESVAPKHLLVMINGKQAAMGQRVAVTQTREPTSINGVDVPVQLQLGVDNLMNFRAGCTTGPW
jgi:hypothetical protein